MKLDNAGFVCKRQLRVNLLRALAPTAPIVLETHAGFGKIYRHCYREFPFGIAIDKKPDAAADAAHARPGWAVYEADSETALRAGLAATWPVNFLDVDPYGDPWTTIAGFFESERERAPEVVVAVTDGLRAGGPVRLGTTWRSKDSPIAIAVARHGNAELFGKYLAVCEELLGELAGRAGYRIVRWTGYYTGNGNQITHYGALLDRRTTSTGC